MKINTTNKVKLGIFISLGITLLIAGIYFIGEKQQLFRSTFHLRGVFQNVSGLQIGNNVRLSGVNVGTIDNITIISDTSVSVEILIDENAREFIKKDAVASIGSEGLMGNKALIINPGTGGKKRIENGDIIKTSMPVDIDDILLTLKTTIENTATITSDLASITNNIESGNGTIGKLIMDKSLAQNFDSSFINLSKGTMGLKLLIDDATVSFGKIHIEEILLSLKTTMDNASEVTNDLYLITSNIKSGNGSLGKLLMDEPTAQNIDSTFKNINDATKELKLLLIEAQNSWLLWGF
ncbi:MAG: hypothetical protein CVV23_17400 [Ignavibacteriae bacterium HGW-Ignavibacteriae-2]|jgi:phospholipid/cholesterol/gamma-HCH transport system substrate-binding protein|nr:MAG: hypothetical protein CVV23_17400 [Ignavibacteriae bacterium HGW-Ignavibacteriae-2]